MTIATRCLFLLTTNQVTPSLSLILSGARSLKVTVMEVALQLATARACGSPVGTRKAEEGMRMCTKDTLSLLKKQGTKGRLLTELNHTECYIHIYMYLSLSVHSQTRCPQQFHRHLITYIVCIE